MEIVSVAQLRANRRYAILVIAVLAMLLPGTDPVTMLLSMLPLLRALRRLYPRRRPARPPRAHERDADDDEPDLLSDDDD